MDDPTGDPFKRSNINAPGWFVALTITVGAFVVGLAFLLASIFDTPSPWTDIDGHLYHRCDGTTGLYRMNRSDVIDAVPNDPRCSKESR